MQISSVKTSCAKYVSLRQEVTRTAHIIVRTHIERLYVDSSWDTHRSFYVIYRNDDSEFHSAYISEEQNFNIFLADTFPVMEWRFINL